MIKMLPFFKVRLEALHRRLLKRDRLHLKKSISTFVLAFEVLLSRCERHGGSSLVHWLARTRDGIPLWVILNG